MQLVSAPPPHSSMQRCTVASGAWRRQGNQLRENLELMLSTLPCATLPIRPPRKEGYTADSAESEFTDDAAKDQEKKEEQSEPEFEVSEAAAAHGMAKPVR